MMTDEELEHWAYSAVDSIRTDFDLEVARPEHAELLIRLAKDPQCPERNFCLHCLYILTAEVVRGGFRDVSRHRLVQLLAEAEHSPDARLARWHSRATELVAKPEMFDYDLWCDGGYLERDASL